LEDELDQLLDTRIVSEGLQRLSTIRALEKMVETLAQADLSDYAQIAMLESGWYMRNQLLRDTDWASMAHGLEVRVPYVDPIVLDRVGPALASKLPPDKQLLLSCTERLPEVLRTRAKTGFKTPVDQWVRKTTGHVARGLRGWAGYVDLHFQTAATAAQADPSSIPPTAAAIADALS
jgi:asparagine synthase (glutamine-hydrolysing)